MSDKRGAQAGRFPRGALLLVVLVGVALLAATRLPGAAWATPGQIAWRQATVPPARAIAGTVYEDLNRDGELDPGEPGIPDVLITLSGPTHTLTTATNSEGGYWFLDLQAGATYTVTQTQPQGYLPTTATTVVVEELPEEGAVVNFGNYRDYRIFLPLVSKGHSSH